MLHVSTRRGRPRGTGIDDSDRIARLDELLRVRPDLKPTTAIRLMGYSDPSAIRRLRDKYKVFTVSTRSRLIKEYAAGSAVSSIRPADSAAPASPLTHVR